jgi:hypothetical protein
MCIDTQLDTPLMRLMQLSDAELGQLVRNAMWSIRNHPTSDVLLIARNAKFYLTEHALGWKLTAKNLPPLEQNFDDDPQTNTGSASSNQMS